MHADPEFQELDVEFVSIAFDSAEQQAAAITEYSISDEVPMLIDPDGSVSEAYDVLQYAVASGEPSHTFVLVNADGEIAWLRDYGSPNNPNQTMYVEPNDLVEQIRDNL